MTVLKGPRLNFPNIKSDFTYLFPFFVQPRLKFMPFYDFDLIFSYFST